MIAYADLIVVAIEDLRKEKETMGEDVRVNMSHLFAAVDEHMSAEECWEHVQVLISSQEICLLGRLSKFDHNRHLLERDEGKVTQLPLIPKSTLGDTHYFDTDGHPLRSIDDAVGGLYILRFTDLRVYPDKDDTTREKERRWLIRRSTIFSKRVPFGS